MSQKIDSIEYFVRGRFKFPLGTSDVLAEKLIELQKSGQRVRFVFRSSHITPAYSRVGYVREGTNSFLILCFDKRSQRGQVLGNDRVLRIESSRKPYQDIYDVQHDDPLAYVMAV